MIAKIRRSLIVAFLILCLLINASPALASGNLWYDKYLAYDSTHSEDFYTSNDSALLAWQESYLLRSYVNLYGLTKSTNWLDKFTNHSDTMLSHATDSDGDGYMGWGTYRYSSNDIKNGTFAVAAAGDSTLPADWTRFQSSSTTAYRASSTGAYNPGSDTWGFVLKTNGTSWQKLYQGIPYEPKTQYRVSFYGKTNGTAAAGRVYVHDRTTNTILANVFFDNTSWQNHTLDFMAPSVAGHDLEIWLGHSVYDVTGGIAYFDDISINGWYPYLVHDGMIGTAWAEFIRLVNKNPTTLAAYTTKANTYRSFIENELVPKWENSSYLGNTWVSVNSSTGYYKEPPNVNSYATTTVLSPLPYNQYLAYAEMLTIMHDVNNDTTYLDRLRKMNQHFKNSLTLNGTAYNWRYAGYTTRVEDTSHGNVDLNAAIELFNKGLIYTGTDMERFANTLTTKVWNQSATSPLLHNYVDGTQGSAASNYLYTKDMSGWLKLSQFEPQAWRIGAEQYRAYTPLRFIEALVLSEIMKWDPVKLVNQGFEMKSSSDSTLPARWNRFQSTASTAYLDASNKQSGTYGVTIISNGTTWQKLYQPWEGYSASTPYTLTFDGKTDGSLAGGKVWVINETTGLTLAAYDFTNTSWQRHTLNFTAPSVTTDNIKIYLGHHSHTISGGKAHFDNIVIKQTSDSW